MSTRTKKTGAKRPTNSSASTKPVSTRSEQTSAGRRSVNGTYIALVVAAVVVVIGVVAVLVTRSNDSGSAGAGPQTYPVQVTGTALAPLPDSNTADSSLGAMAPTLTGQSVFDGSPLTIAPGGGKAKLVVFLAHWCPHCQAEVPRLVQWMNSGQKPADLDVYAVSTANDLSDVNSPASAWLQREKWPTPVLADSADDTAGTAYGLTSFPYLVVLDGNGKVLARSSGEKSVDELNTFVTGALGR